MTNSNIAAQDVAAPPQPSNQIAMLLHELNESQKQMRMLLERQDRRDDVFRQQQVQRDDEHKRQMRMLLERQDRRDEEFRRQQAQRDDEHNRQMRMLLERQDRRDEEFRRQQTERDQKLDAML
ncbi:hypothetical protein LPJ78_005591, partial [Coemansia sp. RSA 989]